MSDSTPVKNGLIPAGAQMMSAMMSPRKRRPHQFVSYSQASQHRSSGSPIFDSSWVESQEVSMKKDSRKRRRKQCLKVLPPQNQPNERTFILSYVTEVDMTGVFTAARRQLTQADMSVLASVDAATEGCRWEVGLRDTPALRRPPFLTKYQALTKEVIMAMMQQRHQKWQQNFHKWQDARKMKFEAVHQHHADVSINYMVIKTERPSYRVQFPRPQVPTIWGGGESASPV